MISVLMPSRGRAKMWFNNLIQASSKATTNPEFLVYVDNDDPQLEQYKSYLPKLSHIDLVFIVDEPKRTAIALKYLTTKAKYDFFIFGSDDLDWRTAGWDEKLMSKMPKHGLSVVYPASIPDNKIKARIPFFTRRWIEITGLYPEDFIHFGPDGWIVKIAESANTEIFVYEVEILHKKIQDTTSSRARTNGTGNWKTIVNSRMPEIVAIGKKVRAAIDAD